jgi:hypothetical protein
MNLQRVLPVVLWSLFLVSPLCDALPWPFRQRRAGRIQALQLVSAPSGVFVASLTNGTIVSLNRTTTPGLTVVAVPDTSRGRIRSVSFDWNAKNEYRTEQTAPYTLCGGKSYDACSDLKAGGHTIAATVKGGSAYRVSFTLVERAPIPPPTVAPKGTDPTIKTPIGTPTRAPVVSPISNPASTPTNVNVPVLVVPTTDGSISVTNAPVRAPMISSTTAAPKAPTKVPTRTPIVAPSLTRSPMVAPTLAPNSRPTNVRAPTQAPISILTNVKAPMIISPIVAVPVVATPVQVPSQPVLAPVTVPKARTKTPSKAPIVAPTPLSDLEYLSFYPDIYPCIGIACGYRQLVVWVSFGTEMGFQKSGAMNLTAKGVSDSNRGTVLQALVNCHIRGGSAYPPNYCFLLNETTPLGLYLMTADVRDGMVYNAAALAAKGFDNNFTVTLTTGLGP